MNSRLDTVQAVVLRAKLAPAGGVERPAPRAAAARYDELLADVPGCVRPVTLPGNGTSGTSTWSGSADARPRCSPS